MANLAPTAIPACGEARRLRYIDSGSRNPAEALGSWLNNELGHEVAELRIQSGFYSAEALLPLRATLTSLTANSGLARVVVGSNDGGTLRSHLDDLVGAMGIPRPNAELGVVYYGGAYFHPKTFHLSRADGSQAAYVGSANFTMSGLAKHIEAGVIVDTRAGDPAELLGAIAAATDAWFSEARPGFERVAGPDDVQRLLDEGVIRTIAPPRPPRPPGQGGQPPQRPPLAPLVVFPQPPAQPPAAGAPAVAWQALPTVQQTPPYPPYILFAPGAVGPTVGAEALTGTGLGDAVGIIYRISRVGDKHWRLAGGTSDISIPVSAAATLRFGVYGDRARPRAEFDFSSRYVDDEMTLVAPETRVGIMSFGFTPADVGHADLRLALPRAPIVDLRERLLAQGKRLPEAGDLAILEWPTPQAPNFRLTVTNPTSTLGLSLSQHWQNAALAGQLASRGAAWLPIGVSPLW